MSQKEQYHLHFSTTNYGSTTLPRCTSFGTLKETPYLAALLDTINIEEAEDLVEEITLAISGAIFDPHFSLDVSPVSLEIQPPYILIDNEVTISLVDLAALLEEWICFCKKSL